MPKRREKDSTEYWRGKFREADKENRHLRKRIKQLEKQEYMFEEALVADEPIEYEIENLRKTCSSCGKGKLSEINVLDRIFEVCDTCGNRKKISGPNG